MRRSVPAYAQAAGMARGVRHWTDCSSPSVSGDQGCSSSKRSHPAEYASSWRAFPLPHQRPHGLYDVLIAGAAAQIAGQPPADLVLGGERILAQQIGDRHQHARRAKAALQRMMLMEGFLHGIELVDAAEAFDGLDHRSVGLHGEHQAGACAITVDDDGAGATNPVLAADMRAG